MMKSFARFEDTSSAERGNKREKESMDNDGHLLALVVGVVTSVVVSVTQHVPPSTRTKAAAAPAAAAKGHLHADFRHRQFADKVADEKASRSQLAAAEGDE